MKPAILLFYTLILTAMAVCQGTVTNLDAHDIIRGVWKAQQSLKTVSYTLARTDTFTTGDTRRSTGKAMIRIAREDSVFGFLFLGRKDGYRGESVYDGHTAYDTDDEQRTYRLITRSSDIPHVLGSPGGQIILTDLISLDTAKAISMKAWGEGQNIYILFNYPDLKAYDVTKRSKTVTIDKKTMLPTAMRSHQETLGKVQDLYYRITDIQVNSPSFEYDFSAPAFLKSYSQQNIQPDRSVLALKGSSAPAFVLSSFSGSEVASASLQGKAVLLDFWEVWCGPCIESMPKVEQLYSAYKDKGLQVFGVVNDLKQLESAKRFVEKRALKFPMLVGNEGLVRDYKVNGVPQYVLIDKQGKISFISVGYSAELEAAIKNSLQN
ncbi:MAG: redoxin domain-containing protein [Williamsia sp.]|nr:redoxin domain-containing protein [Williamsia sp.]